MVFSSVSAYLDLPHWQQEHSHSHQIIQEMNTTNTTTTTTNSAATNPIVVLPTQFQNNPSNGSPVANPARPMTVSERARLANIPVPEPALKCPRCDSTNTKFCYFNNYSLTQPRHFCKTCRRYWTRGGALRNVPVGGGCRRTRKPTSSKSTSSKQAASSTTTANTNGTSNNALHQSLRFLSPPLGQGFLGSADHHLGFGHDSSLMMSGFGEMNAYGSSSLVEPWAQLQFMGGSLDPTTANYGGFNSCVDDQVVMRGKQISSSLLNHLGPLKMEGSCNNHHDVSKQLLMNMGGGLDDHHHWNNVNSNVNACWNEISGFSSSSASNALYLS